MCVRQVWDVRQKRSVQTLTERYQVTAVAWADAGDQVSLLQELLAFHAVGPYGHVLRTRPTVSSPEGIWTVCQVYSAGVENLIQVWDLRKAEVVLQLTGHSDSITGLRVSPDGTHLLSNAMVPPFRGIWSTLILPKPVSAVQPAARPCWQIFHSFICMQHVDTAHASQEGTQSACSVLSISVSPNGSRAYHQKAVLSSSLLTY